MKTRPNFQVGDQPRGAAGRSGSRGLSNKKMIFLSISNSILNEKMLNFCFEKSIFEQKIVNFCQNFGKQIVENLQKMKIKVARRMQIL